MYSLNNLLSNLVADEEEVRLCLLSATGNRTVQDSHGNFSMKRDRRTERKPCDLVSAEKREQSEAATKTTSNRNQHGCIGPYEH